jgi:hypothetical protein
MVHVGVLPALPAPTVVPLNKFRLGIPTLPILLPHNSPHTPDRVLFADGGDIMQGKCRGAGAATIRPQVQAETMEAMWDRSTG